MASRRGRLALGALLCCALVAGSAGAARSDIDPASDVLLLQDVFLPYQPQVCSEVKGALAATVKRSRAAGYPVKVALISDPSDLGAAPQFFGRPPAYANFLGRELALYGHGVSRKSRISPLVVVMPQGWGFYEVDPRPASAAERVRIPQNADPNGLARAAIGALPRLARAAGHPVQAVVVPSGCSHSGGSSAVLFLAPIAVVVLGGLLVSFWLRGRSRTESRTERQA
jgi:hypothetical protein